MLTLLVLILTAVILSAVLGVVLKVVFGVGKAVFAVALLPITIIGAVSGMLPLVIIALFFIVIISSLNKKKVQ